MVKYFVCTIVFTVSAVVLKAQSQSVIDSLQAVLKHQSGAEKVNTLFELAFEYAGENRMEALSSIEKACEEAEIVGDSSWIVTTKRVRGEVLLGLFDEIEMALLIFQEALPIAKRNSFVRDVCNIERDIGKCYVFKGRYDKALVAFMTALPLTEQMGDSEKKISVLHAIGITYYKLNDYRTALQFYSRAAESAMAVKWPFIHVLYSNTALCYAELGEIMRAEQYLTYSDETCGSHCSSSHRINLEFARGLTSLRAGCSAEAEQFFWRSLRMAENDGNIRFQLDNIYFLSELYLKRKEFHKAWTLLQKGLGLVEPGSSFNLEHMKLYLRLSEYYVSIGDLNRAFDSQSKYIMLRDSIYSDELINNLMKAEASFVQRENDVRIGAQKQLIELHRGLLEEQKMRNAFAISVIVLGAIVMYFLFREYRRKKTLNDLLDERVKERTKELEQSRSTLLSTLKQHELSAERVMTGVVEGLSTVKGLCCIARKESTDRGTGMYIDKVEATLNQIENHVRSATSHLTDHLP